MFGKRVYKIGHISENTFGQDSKTHTNDNYVPFTVLRQRKMELLYTSKINSRFFSAGITVKQQGSDFYNHKL